jgi:hypothetical protein
VLKLNDASNFRRTAAGLSLTLGPLLIALGQLLQPGQDVDGAPYLDAVARDAEAMQLSIILSYLGFVLLAFGIIGAVHVIRGRGVVLAHLAGGLAVVGLISITALIWTGLYDISIAENAPRPIGLRVYEAPEDYFAAIVLLALALLGTAIGLILVAVALWRGGLAPIWVWPVVIVAFLFIFIEPLGSKASSLIGDLLLLAAFGFVGLKLLRMSDREWDRGVGEAPARVS